MAMTVSPITLVATWWPALTPWRLLLGSKVILPWCLSWMRHQSGSAEPPPQKLGSLVHGCLSSHHFWLCLTRAVFAGIPGTTVDNGGGKSWGSSHHHTGSHSLLGLSLQVLIHDGPLSPPPALHAVTQFSQVPKRHRKTATGGAYTKGDIGLRILSTRPLSQLFLPHVPP